MSTITYEFTGINKKNGIQVVTASGTTYKLAETEARKVLKKIQSSKRVSPLPTHTPIDTSRDIVA